MNFELFFQDIIKEKRRGFIPSLIRFPLKLLSYPFGFVVSCRNWAYDHGWFKQYSAPLPLVVSVGNITAGGTGKTPLTLLFAKTFENETKVAIASRGYRSKCEHLNTPVVVTPQLSPEICGDEPYLLADNLRKTLVFSGKNRLKAANMAAEAGAQILILDDGMQHRQLARDYDIVVLDARDPFGKGYFLPYGLLRDDVNSLSRASMIVLNHITDHDFEEIKTKISPFTKAPVVGVKMVVENIFDLFGVVIEGIKGKKVGIFCGIASPDQFLRTVQGLGAEVVAEMYFPDHQLGDNQTLAQFAEKCRAMGATMLLCSEKDKVKLLNDSKFVLPIGWAKMRLDIVEGNANWEKFIQKIKKNLDSRSIR